MKKKFQSRLPRFASLLTTCPQALAMMEGNAAYPQMEGMVRFYQTKQGVLVSAEIAGLPMSDAHCSHSIFGFHIHSGNHCKGDEHDPFSEAMSHYNPADCEHPFHAGDLPPLFGNCGYAFHVFLTNRFLLSEIMGKTLIIYGKPDDFTTQPSGNAGEKIACGKIVSCKKNYL